VVPLSIAEISFSDDTIKFSAIIKSENHIKYILNADHSRVKLKLNIETKSEIIKCDVDFQLAEVRTEGDFTVISGLRMRATEKLYVPSKPRPTKKGTGGRMSRW